MGDRWCWGFMRENEERYPAFGERRLAISYMADWLRRGRAFASQRQSEASVRMSGRRTRRTRTLKKGWSHAVKPSEVPRVFPGAASVVFVGGSQSWRDDRLPPPVFDAQWSFPSAQAQPVLRIWPVPSHLRRDVGAWIESQVAGEFQEWFERASESDVRRDANKLRWWAYQVGERPGE